MKGYNPWLGVLLGVLSAGAAFASPRSAGTVVAIQGEHQIVELGEEPAVGPGTVLTVWRRAPAARGEASYREAAVWFEVASLTVLSVGEGVAVTTRTGDPAVPMPAALDESGAPPEEVHVGDRVRTTGAVSERPVDVRVTFARTDLFGDEDVDLPARGRTLLSRWLAGLVSMELPITVEVHGRFPELGAEVADASRALSAEEDRPFGPAPGEPVVPVDGLREPTSLPAAAPPGDEVMVVGGSLPDGSVDTWRYLDPVTLAWRRGDRLASALAVHLEIPREGIVVRVVPRGISAEYSEAPGYDRPGDQIRVLAAGMVWTQPPPPNPPSSPPEPREPDEEAPPQKRRLLEPAPSEVTLRSPRRREPTRRRR